MNFTRWLHDTAERVLSTLVEATVIFLLAAVATGDEVLAGLATACVIAVANVIKAALTAWIPTPATFYGDLFVRAVWTFLISVCGALASVSWLELIDLNWWQVTLRSASVAALAVVKALFARSRAGTLTPASLARGAAG